MELKNQNLSDYSKIANEIISLAGKIKIWTFEGNLGAGKTTLIKQLCKEMGIQDSVHSPTFSLVNNYDDKVFHFDCYRLNNLEEAMDFGMEEYLDSDKICLIEWPALVNDILPYPRLSVEISYNHQKSRDFLIKILD